MAKAFAQLTFTPAVRSLQERYGSRQAYQRFEQGPVSGDRLGPSEQQFVQERDGFTNPPWQPVVGPTSSSAVDRRDF